MPSAQPQKSCASTQSDQVPCHLFVAIWPTLLYNIVYRSKQCNPFPTKKVLTFSYFSMEEDFSMKEVLGGTRKHTFMKR